MNLPEIREMKGSARNQIYENMKQWIIEGTLKPGEKISDFDIASHFHVSRTPVREAFQQLEMQKLIRSYPGKATFVTEMETENIGQWYLPMISLQQLAASMAVEKVTEEQILQLKEKGEVFSRLVESRGSLWNFSRQTETFMNIFWRLRETIILLISAILSGRTFCVWNTGFLRKRLLWKNQSGIIRS